MAHYRPQLRLIEGDLSRTFALCGFTLHICDVDTPLPRDIEARVVEQDTTMLMEPPTRLDVAAIQGDSGSSYSRLIGEMLLEEADYRVGNISLRDGDPARIMLVIHDLSQTPSWNERGIKRALRTLFAMLPRYRFSSLALPALAHRHGRLPVERFLTLLCEEMREKPPLWGGDIWLQVPREALTTALQTLQNLSAPPDR